MADKWIVTDKEYVKHDTLGAAEHERDRLCGTIPRVAYQDERRGLERLRRIALALE